MIKILPFHSKNQTAIKALILDGLVDHWGTLDESKNPDLNKIATIYADANFLVAWLDDEIIGTGAAIPRSEKQVEIVRMSVSKKLRRKGSGWQILSELCRQAAKAGYQEVILETTETWQDVIDFYLNYGFEITHYSDGDAYFKLNLANFLIQVIKDYQAPYPDPIQAKQGEIITLDMQKETPIAGWVWCTSSSGKSGWVPESYIEIQDNLTGEMRCDYDAIELTIHKGDVLTVLKRESDFYWARNEKEQEGWIPIAHTDLYRK